MRSPRNNCGLRPLLVLVMAFTVAGCHRAGSTPAPATCPSRSSAPTSAPATCSTRRRPTSRLALYLDELSAAGYRKQIRIILPPDWGPRIYEHWFPVIRARGFKVLAILGQERRDSAADVPAAVAWVKHILPLVRDDLIGVQIVNEPAYTFTPAGVRRLPPRGWRRWCASWRRGCPSWPAISACRRRARTRSTSGKAIVAAGATDYDVLSIHVTGSRKEGELADFAARLRAFARAAARSGSRKGDWGQLRFLREQGSTWRRRSSTPGTTTRCRRLIRRPGGRSVLPCFTSR